MTAAAGLEIDIGNAPWLATGGAGTSGARSTIASRSEGILPSPSQNGIVEQQSFRSNWQQEVAVLDNPANEESHAVHETGFEPTAATGNPLVSSPRNGNLPRAAMPGQVLKEAIQSPETQPAPISAALAHASAASDQQEAASEAARESSTGSRSVADNTRPANHGTTDRPATAKTSPLHPVSSLLNDAGAALASQVVVPFKPAAMPKSAVSSAAEFSSAPAREPIANPQQASAAANQAARGLVSNLAAPNTNSAEQNVAARAQEATEPVEESSGSPSGLAIHSAEPAAEEPGLTPSRAETGQSTAAPENASGNLQAAQSAPSAMDSVAVGSLSSLPDGEAVRAQIAPARATAGAQFVRGHLAGDSQFNSTAVEGIHNQLSSPAAGSALVRETAVIPPSNAGPQPAAQTAPGISTTETFSALDGTDNSMHATWIHAGAHQAEAGFEDPSLGWVSVRAGSNAGSISAVVVPGSADATQALGAHMAGLHDYLREQRSPVENLTMEPAQNYGNDGSLNQEMHHQGHQQSAQESPDRSPVLNPLQASSSAAGLAEAPFSSVNESPAILPASGGRYISVLA